MRRKTYLPKRTQKAAIFRHILLSIETPVVCREAKQVSPMRRDIADGFKTYARGITEHLVTHRHNTKELGYLYNDYRRWIREWGKLAEQHVKDCPDFGGMPRLIGSDFYAVLMRLAEYCEHAATLLETA
jgi:hypothetical protein